LQGKRTHRDPAATHHDADLADGDGYTNSADRVTRHDADPIDGDGDDGQKRQADARSPQLIHPYRTPT